FGIFLNYFLTDRYGYYAISMAGFITTGIYGISLLFYSRRIIGRFGKFTRYVILMILSGSITLSALLFLKIYIFSQYISYHFQNLFLILLINSIITALIYLAITHLLKVNYVSGLLNSLKK
ncbi:MAG: hypothetical protein R2942_20370, partial [Ignavibacteria bacterium]